MARRSYTAEFKREASLLVSLWEAPARTPRGVVRVQSRLPSNFARRM